MLAVARNQYTNHRCRGCAAPAVTARRRASPPGQLAHAGTITHAHLRTQQRMLSCAWPGTAADVRCRAGAPAPERTLLAVAATAAGIRALRTQVCASLRRGAPLLAASVLGAMAHAAWRWLPTPPAARNNQ